MLPGLFGVDSAAPAFHDFDELVNGATRLLDEAGLTSRLGDIAVRPPRPHL